MAVCEQPIEVALRHPVRSPDLPYSGALLRAILFSEAPIAGKLRVLDRVPAGKKERMAPKQEGKKVEFYERRGNEDGSRNQLFTTVRVNRSRSRDRRQAHSPVCSSPR
ncbi:hypothetical protein CBM2606_A10137 [Cupriavidus taiwanensis]|nr:hypothetical protein CBM2606_A10137 [Cupriavidus taiwanensis]